jgi:hypothetical protein
MFSHGKEATDFDLACEAIHILLSRGRLTPDDRALIEFSGTMLLSKVRQASLHHFTPAPSSPSSKATPSKY